MSNAPLLGSACCCQGERPEPPGDACWTGCCEGSITKIEISAEVSMTGSFEFDSKTSEIINPNKYSRPPLFPCIPCAPGNNFVVREERNEITGAAAVTLEADLATGACVVVEERDPPEPPKAKLNKSVERYGIVYDMAGAGTWDDPCCPATAPPFGTCASLENTQTSSTNSNLGDGATAGIGVFFKPPGQPHGTPIFGENIE